MAKFLNTSGVTYHLEQLIKSASERLILISPFLKFNDRMRELLEDKDRLKLDVRVIYGKNELQPDEIYWLRTLNFVRTSFCRNLHAKCYMNESQAIITSMNLYEFSQVNNNEMGILIERDADGPLYRETYEEAQRLIRVSDEIKLSVEKVEAPNPADALPLPVAAQGPQLRDVESDGNHDTQAEGRRQISTTQLSKELGIPSRDLWGKFLAKGWIVREGDAWKLTDLGRSYGGTVRNSPRFGEYIAWPSDLKID